jgi:RNA polymerase sigma factor (sigma-70 family)
MTIPLPLSVPDAAFEAERARLFSLAYRMLGSRAEAEDLLQDAWLKWHAARADAIHTPAAWLTTVTTRLAIDRLRHWRTERAARQDGGWPEPWLDALAPSAETCALDGARLSYGLMLLLDRLTPDERAAFLLREAFDCDYAEIGRALGKPDAHCRQLVHRAKGRLGRAGELRAPADPARQRDLVDALRVAIDAQDRHALLAVLARVRLVSDAPAPAAAPVLAAARAEPLALGDDAALALFADDTPEIVALLVPARDADGQPMLCAITCAAALAGVNRRFGRAALAALFARIAARVPVVA